MDLFLEGNKFVAGSEQPTIADLSILASVANIVVSENILTISKLLISIH